LTDTATVRERDGAAKRYKLDRQYGIEVPVTIPAGGITWLTIAGQ